MAITRELLRVLRKDIDAALKSVGERHGVALHAGNASFGGNNANFKLEVAAIGSDGKVLTPEVEALKGYKDVMGLKFGYGDTFTLRGTKYKVTGLKPRSPKYPVIAEKIATGESYKFPLDTVNRNF